MKKRIVAALVLAAAAIGPASAQPADDRGGVSTDRQDREGSGNSNLMWNLLGLVGLVGLTGMWRPTDNDGYTDDPI